MNILIVQTGFLGDLILSTPVIANVQRLYPQAKISMLTTPGGKQLVEYHPAISEVIVFDKRGIHSGWKGLLTMAQLLRERRFSKAFSLHKSYRTAVLLLLAKIPERFGFREAAGWWLYTKTARRKHLSHDVLRNLAVLETQNLKLEKLDQRMFLGVGPEAEVTANEHLSTIQNRGQGIIGIAPGSVWATKRWTPSGFAEVARHFSALGYEIVLLGGNDDTHIAQEIAQSASVSILNLVGKLSLAESAAVISQLNILISNDSAPLHMASAMKTPVVAVFCATVPEFGFSPWQVPHENVGVHGLSCRPCRRHGGNHCPTGTHACQLQLSPAMVVQAVERVLDRAALGQREQSFQILNSRISQARPKKFRSSVSLAKGLLSRRIG